LFRASIAQQQAGEILDTRSVTPGFGTAVAVGAGVNDRASSSPNKNEPLIERTPENGESQD
jgi:hypothetical protein